MVLVPHRHAPDRRPPRRGPASQSGQASADYAALLALVAIALAGAGVAAGRAGVPARIVEVVRTGLCMVGGDVCRPVDAAADGLEPCLTRERARGGRVGVTIVSLHLGHGGSWTVAERSDGSVLVTRADDDFAGLTGGIGVDVPGVGISIGASGDLDLVLAHGSAWELPSAAAAARLLAAVGTGDEPAAPPTWRFGDAGAELSGEIGAQLDPFAHTHAKRDVSPAESGGALVLTALEASAGASAGVRLGRGERTVYVRLRAGASSSLLPLRGPAAMPSSAPDGGGRSSLLVGLTRDAHGLRELTFERAQPGAAAGEVVDTVARLDLRDPANRAAVAPLLAGRLTHPSEVATSLRAAIAHTARAGIVERSVYRVTDRSNALSFAIRAGIDLGVDADQIDVERRLVAASAWTHGSPERRRFDCVPGAAA